jgi:hypothetical protein
MLRTGGREGKYRLMKKLNFQIKKLNMMRWASPAGNPVLRQVVEHLSNRTKVSERARRDSNDT